MSDEPRPLTTETRRKMFALSDEPRPLTTETRRKMFAFIDEDQRYRMGVVLGREITSRKELTEDDAEIIIDALRAEKNRREIAAEMGRRS